MRILGIISGEYGKRHIDNIRKHGPAGWEIEVWQAPTHFPLVIDYPEDYIPERLSPADLILSFAEHRGVAELLPDLVTLSGAKGVIAAIDNESWLPRGLARQLRGWIEKLGANCVTPKPLCSLTENDFGVTRRQRISYICKEISEFALHFGQPKLKLEIDPSTNMILSAAVERDAVCGCARYVADRLAGLHVNEAEEQTGLLHHHYPCLASMGIDTDFSDTLLHVSGNVLKDNIAEQVRPYKITAYVAPGTRSE